jgi:NagD protein
MGLEIDEENFYTSALATAAFLSNQSPGCSAYVIGAPGLHNALYDAGITMNDVNPDYVIVGETSNYNFEGITRAIAHVLNGARRIGTNPDRTGPTETGIMPACRALIAPIELATGRSAYFIGKPNALMMRTGLRMLGVHSADAVMIGDRMDTDIIAGIETGLDTALVLSGVTTRDEIKTFPYRPKYIFEGVGEIVS